MSKYLPGLVKSPLLWGAVLSVSFFWLIGLEVWNPTTLKRYCAGHPVEYAETALFFVGLAALAIKAAEVYRQYPGLHEPILGPLPAAVQPASDSRMLLGRLERLGRSRQGEYRVRRLRQALVHVARLGKADGLSDELKYLADESAAEAYTSYGLVRLIIWAIPILGFLGTVIGIALAMANLSPQELEKSLPQVMSGLTVAFDTTALALTLSMILFFIQHAVERGENQLLSSVAQSVAGELEGRFETRADTTPDGQWTAVRRTIEAMISATEQASRQQAENWRQAIEATSQRLGQLTAHAAGQLEEALGAAISESVASHARSLAAGEAAQQEKSLAVWQRIEQSLARNSEALAAMQKGVVAQADVLGRAVAAAGEVRKLETELNRNLSALAGSRNFEDTVMSLAAAIQLLTSRLTAGGPAPRISLEIERPKSQAA